MSTKTQDVLLNLAMAEGAIKTKISVAEDRLEKLRTTFPDQLASFVLGEITNSELKEVKSQIAELIEFLQVAPDTLRGLARRKETLEKAEKIDRRGQRKVEAVKEYEALKAKIQTHPAYDRTLEVRFFGTASAAGRRGEAEEVVKRWKLVLQNRSRA